MNLVEKTNIPEIITRFPNHTIAVEIRSPAIIKIDPIVIALLAFMTGSPTFMNLAVNTGFITNATKREEPSTMANVIGK